MYKGVIADINANVMHVRLRLKKHQIADFQLTLTDSLPHTTLLLRGTRQASMDNRGNNSARERRTINTIATVTSPAVIGSSPLRKFTHNAMLKLRFLILNRRL